MTTETPQRDAPESRKSAIQWLLDSDPSIRWQVMRDLMDESDEVVAGERSRVASEGWGCATTAVKDARLRGQEYFLARGMFRSLSTGEVIDPGWTEFSFPTRWHYDVLSGLDYLRRAGVEPDQRVAEAIDLVEKKRDGDGRWPLENPHAGAVHFDMEDGAGKPGRWNTLRALRVLDWYSARD
jgi:hypothetical protein